jgi:hypothetical protein
MIVQFLDLLVLIRDLLHELMMTSSYCVMYIVSICATLICCSEIIQTIVSVSCLII